MSHSAGFPEDNPWGDQQLSATDAQLTERLRIGIPFSTPPGTRYEYSNYAFALLGRAVTKASGVPYERYVRSEILSKLKMDNTTFEFSEAPAAERAVGYRAPARWNLPGGSAAAARRIRRDGRTADHCGGPGQICRVPSFGVASAR